MKIQITLDGRLYDGEVYQVIPNVITVDQPLVQSQSEQVVDTTIETKAPEDTITTQNQ